MISSFSEVVTIISDSVASSVDSSCSAITMGLKNRNRARAKRTIEGNLSIAGQDNELKNLP